MTQHVHYIHIYSHVEHVHCIHLLNVSFCRVEGGGLVLKATLLANLVHMVNVLFRGVKGGSVFNSTRQLCSYMKHYETFSFAGEGRG